MRNGTIRRIATFGSAHATGRTTIAIILAGAGPFDIDDIGLNGFRTAGKTVVDAGHVVANYGDGRVGDVFGDFTVQGGVAIGGTVDDYVESLGGTVLFSAYELGFPYARLATTFFAPGALVNNLFVGDDRLFGGPSDDVLRGADGSDVLVGGNGSDVLDGGGGIADLVSYTSSPSAVTVDLTAGTAVDGFGRGDGLLRLENVEGSNFDDLITGNTMANTLKGFGGNDVLLGAGAGDVIFGHDGNDLIGGGDGNDVIDAGDGNDAVDAGKADDVVSGGAGDDVIVGEFGADLLEGGPGSDRINGGTRGDVLYGDDGNDFLAGGQDGDRILGGLGDDVIDGGSGADSISAGAGADQIDGGFGNDDLAGGRDGDLFFFDREPSATDRIFEFEPGVDHIVLRDTSVADSLGGAITVDGSTVLPLGNDAVIVVVGVLGPTADWFLG